MKKSKYFFIKIMLAMIVSGLLLPQQLLAQSSTSVGAVLRLTKNKFNSYFNTGVNFSDLLNQGQAQQASFEFWMKSTGSNNEWVLTDLLADSESFSMQMANNHQLKVRLKNVEKTIDLTGLSIGRDTWHHVAFTTNSQATIIYINGRVRGVFTDLNFTSTQARQLYFYKSRETELFITEVRAWNQARTKQMIERYWAKTFKTEEISLHTPQGLSLLLNTTSQQTTNSAKLSTLEWNNAISGSALKLAKGVAVYKPENLTLMLLSTTIGHPILDLNQIFVKGSKGQFTDKVQLTWNHIKNAQRYIVSRRTQAGATFVTLPNPPSIDTKASGDDIVFEDKSLAAGERYVYKVEALGNNSFTTSGQVTAFVFYNGQISGQVATNRKDPVQDVEITAALKTTGGVEGKALAFSPTSTPIEVDNIEALRNQPRLTIEFWYKGSGDNTVFALGNSKVSFVGNKLKVTNTDNTAYLEGALKTQNSEWHHYAFTFTPVLDQDNKPVGALGKLYQDGEEIATTNQAYQAPAGHVNSFSIGAVNQAAYQLDEFKVWKIAKTAKRVTQTYRHVMSGEEEGLLLYYRFDEGSGKEVYNYALDTRNDYIGKSTAITWSNDQHRDLYYGTLTSVSGAYVLKGLNYGAGGTGKTFNVIPKKPNHTFRTVPTEVLLQRGTAIAKSGVNFTDVSQFTISGRVLYEEGDQVYPVPQGQQILLKNDSGTEIFATGDKAKTDATGQFVASASPERLRIRVNALELPRTNLTNKSLRFDGKNAYARSEGTIVHKGNTTWSFWVKPASASEKFDGEVTATNTSGGTTTTPTLPQNQTIFAIGNIHLNLETGETLVLKKGETELVRSTKKISNTALSFCAIVYEAATQKFTLYVNDTPDVSNAIANVDLSGRFVLGALLDGTTPKLPFRGHIDHIEYRQSALTSNDDLKKIKEGKAVANEQLTLRYPIAEAMGIRTLSLTAGAQNHGLKFVGGVQRDNKIVTSVQGSYQYNYIATNKAYNPTGEAYTLNIDGVKTDLNFKNTTRYGFVGNVIVPCDNTIGELEGKIFRTDISGFEKTFDASNFNGNVFTVEGLIPGKYRVEIKRKGASAGTEPLLRSPVLDITQGWASYDFEYHNPLEISYKLYEVDIVNRIRDGRSERKGQRGKEVVALCNGNYALQAYKNYELELTVSEDYNGSKCEVPQVQYTVSGKLGTIAKGHATGSTNKNGKGIVRFLSAGPSFSATNYLEQFQISATASNRTQNAFVKSFIKGSKRLTSDFTVREPQLLYVLHDPPGDGSTAKLEKGTSISFAVNYSTDVGVETETEVSTGVDIQTTFGSGIGVFVLNRLFENQNETGINIDVANVNTIDHSTLWTFTLNETYETSGNSDIVGPDADLLIGAGKVITYGGSQELVIDENTCVASVRHNPRSSHLSYTTPFAFSVQHVKDVTIPGFDKLISDANAAVANGQKTRAQADKDIKNYQHQKAVWQKMIDDNYKKIAQANTYDKLRHGYQSKLVFNPLDFEKGDFALSGGGQTYDVELTWGKEHNTTNTHEINGKIGTPFINSTTISGVKVDVKTQVNAIFNNRIGATNTNGSSTGISFTLSDDDQGDQFHILMRRDPDYDTPIFKTLAGRSSCPYERGTQPREGVRIEVMNGNTQVTPAGTKAIYQLRLTNTQISEDATNKAYILDIEESSNTKGAKILLNGTVVGKGRRFMLAPKASTTAELTIEQNASNDVTYDGIKINFYSECEYALDNTFSYTPDELYERNEDGTVKKDANGNPVSIAKINDHVLLNARFATPCVSKFDVKQPTTDWVVNNTSNNQLSLRFKPEQAQSNLKKIEVEYATEGNNNAQLLTNLDVSGLTKDSEGFYTTTVDVSGLTDGKYNIRLVPICGDAGTNRNNVSEWIAGIIQRSAPIIASVTPVSNGMLTTGGTISATYTDKISNDGVNSLNVNVMGVLANTNYTPTAAQFTQSTHQIQIPDQNVLDMESYTVEFWVKALHPSVEVPIIDKGSNFNIRLRADGKINTGRVVSGQAITPNEWTHVAVTYDAANTTQQIYFNGRLVADQNLSLVPKPHFSTNAEPMTIAKAVGAQGFRGSLDEVRIWNIARTDVGIINNYRKMLLGNEANLVGYYRLDNNALTINGVKEGIRDFTGNASGTTATGITWITGQAAAPLAAEAVPQSIPVTVQRNGDNQILVTPSLADSDLEGAFLTVTIANNKIKDLSGNTIAGKSWSFRYNKSHVSWDQRNIDVQQTWQQTKTFDLTLRNEGATNVTYELVDLPAWLQAPSKTNGQSYGLAHGSQEKIGFVIKPWLNAGTHTALVKAKTYDASGRLLGFEQVTLNVSVNCDAPAYTLNTLAYRYSMTLHASLHINGKRSIDENDQVVAYVVGNDGKAQVRGVAGVRKQGSQYLVSMLIYSNERSGEALSFRVWDASDCREYSSVQESYTFTSDAILGSNSAPRTLTVGNTILRRFALKKGFHQVTFNATDQGQNYLSIAQVKGLAAGSNIEAQDGRKAVYDGNTWSGTLTQLLPVNSYSLELKADATVELQGAKPNLNTTIQLRAGANWLGYLSDKTYEINKALSSLTIGNNTSNLQISGKNGISAYDNSQKRWVGSLEYLSPNVGYRLNMPTTATLNYATSIGQAAAANSRMATNIDEIPVNAIRREAQSLGMQVNPLQYRYTSHIIGVLMDKGQRLDEMDYILTAHAKNNEVRGVAVPQMVGDKLVYFLTIHSNSKTAAFEVRLTNRTTKEVQSLQNVVNYQANARGSLATPYEFRTSAQEAKAGLFAGYRLYQNQPNPFHEVTSISYELPQADQVHLTVYNAQGQVVAVLTQGERKAGKHTVQWQRNNLPAGVYFYTLTTQGAKPITKRLVIR